MPNTNTLTDLIQPLLGLALPTLRESAVMPRLVNKRYDLIAGQQFSTVEIPVASAITAQDVTPGPTPPDNAGVAPTIKVITVDTWKDASFFLTDQDLTKVASGVIPMQAKEAVKSLGNAVDASLWALYKKVYGYAGVAAITPFATDLQEAINARKVLNKQLAAKGERFLVMNDDAEANALGNRSIQDQSWRQNQSAIIEGHIARTLGFDWFASQNAVSHTSGTAADATTNNAGYALGVKTVTLAAAGTGTVLAGDVITFAGQTQTYTVVTGDADVSNGGTVVFEPGLKTAIAGANTAITVKASHAVNLAFHRDAFALVSKPFAGSDPANLGTFDTIVDEVTGLVLRLEVTRQHKRTNWAFDILWGVGCPLPEYAARIAG